ncbi:hypothetical protein [Streptomyces sp. NRRL F-5135]|uniref:hypothetical protein n=1 Tax=Streptomyces sp. NRRL F-5135 TaxID=1463858 RepID=UPI00131EAA45|nr:hypothetical protein [Streptomyces sp. NRRL F-5135]
MAVQHRTVAPAATITPTTVLSAAAGAVPPGFWTAGSGEPVTGDAVAVFLEAVAARLARDGWTRVIEETPASVGEIAPEASTKSLLRHLIDLARDAFGEDRGPLTLYIAMLRTSRSTAGDSDVMAVADRVLDLVVQARTGVERARAMSWSGRLGRTADDVAGLLAAGAEYARTHGLSEVAS